MLACLKLATKDASRSHFSVLLCILCVPRGVNRHESDLPPENQSMNCESIDGSWTHSGKGKDMARTRYQAEEIIRKLRAIEVHIAQGLKAEEAARKE